MDIHAQQFPEKELVLVNSHHDYTIVRRLNSNKLIQSSYQRFAKKKGKM